MYFTEFLLYTNKIRHVNSSKERANPTLKKNRKKPRNVDDIISEF